MRQWQAVTLLVTASPLVALAGVKSGLLLRSPAVPLWYLLLVAPFWEEAFFRGGLQSFLLERSVGNYSFLRISSANAATAVCFAAAHLPFQGLAATAVLLPSLLLGWLFERTRRVFPCVLLHCWFNLSWLLAGYCERFVLLEKL